MADSMAYASHGNKKTLDILCPCYNEEDCIDRFYTEVSNAMGMMRGYAFSVIFIDDGSNDGTMASLRRLEVMHGAERVKYISFSRNFGKEAAILSGLEASTGDLVVVMDADLQDPPSLLPEMLMAMEEGFDSCAAFRASRRGEPPLRSFFARGFYRLMNSMSAIELKQGARDYRMMTRQVVEAVLALTETERFSKGLFQWVGFSTKWIGYQNVQRTVGRTKWSFSSLLKYAVGGIVAFSTVPLRIAALLGLAVDAAAVAYMLYVFIRVMAFGTASSGFATTIIIMLFLGGTTITILGIIGEYIARIYSEVKRRPAYLLKETNIEAMRGVLRSDAAS